ncbi:hypothetical protein CAEBREN_10643 [Caenorhabditis brenneri]|uniref:F-box domain-containing protein n=1 Tax=Caenorhabditis brenneri TaxID=135651 RepID=G0MMI6_CAEBE|nr:hypothetical protein CAEBREN_10643 [Caenorhabditis brenneri]
MSFRPMSYDSLCKILQHIEANKRIEMALRIPSIRSAEKSVPLKIDNLFFDKCAFYVNQTKYEFGLYRHYGTQETPEFIRIQNSEKGSKNDVDAYGFERYDWYRPLPGDFVMNTIEIEEPLPHDINTIKEKEREIRAIENRLNRFEAESRNIQNMGIMDWVKFSISYNPQEIDGSKSKLEKLRYQLQCYYCLRDNTPTPFKPYLQLTTTTFMNYRRYYFNQRGIQKIELVEYKMTLPEAMKIILKVILGNRKHPVHVNNMRMTDEYIIRAPTDLKLKIQKLDIGGSLNRVWNTVSSIIHTSSLPLKELSVDKYYAVPPNLELEIAKTAKKLILRYERAGFDWLPFLLSLENKSVEKEQSELLVTEYIELVSSWVSNGKQVGTNFSFHTKKKKTVKEVVEQIIQQGLGTAKTDGRIMIPMQGCSELQVSYSKRGRDWYEDWILKFKVVNLMDEVRDGVVYEMNKLNIQ